MIFSQPICSTTRLGLRPGLASSWLGDAWEVNRETRTHQRVVVRFGPSVARRVAVMQWHEREHKTFGSDGSLTYSADVEGMDEIAGWIMSFGQHAEVIEPPELRTELLRRVREMAAMYQPDE